MKSHIRHKVNEVYQKHHGKITLVEHVGHGCYFSLVFLQGHGFYTWFAGALAVGVVIHLLAGSIDDHAE